MKTLVIHPEDASTDFLKTIYEDIENKTVLSTGLTFEKIATELQKDYDLILLLGHGWQGGLYDRKQGGTAVTGEHAPYLRGKNVVAVFCNAKDYFEIFNISGFATGMFISEPHEAIDYAVVTNKEQINESSTLFARVMKTAVKTPEKIKEVVDKNYLLENNPVVKINRQFMDIDPWDD